jgi:hypothetical protein
MDQDLAIDRKSRGGGDARDQEEQDEVDGQAPEIAYRTVAASGA